MPVRCRVCGKLWDTPDPGVLSRPDGWWCRSGQACQRRRMALIDQMQAALDAVWASLEADGWRWPA